MYSRKMRIFGEYGHLKWSWRGETGKAPATRASVAAPTSKTVTFITGSIRCSVWRSWGGWNLMQYPSSKAMLSDKSVVRPTSPINLTCCSFLLLFSFLHFLLALHDDSSNKINKNATERQIYRTTLDNCVARCVLHTSFHRIRTARLLRFMRGEIRPMTWAGLACDSFAAEQHARCTSLVTSPH